MHYFLSSSMCTYFGTPCYAFCEENFSLTDLGGLFYITYSIVPFAHSFLLYVIVTYICLFYSTIQHYEVFFFFTLWSLFYAVLPYICLLYSIVQHFQAFYVANLYNVYHIVLESTLELPIHLYFWSLSIFQSLYYIIYIIVYCFPLVTPMTRRVILIV